MRIVNDRVDEMRIFVKIVELLSFTKAAEALQLTTPTVSRMMRRLEERANVRLLHRSTRRVRLTPEGAAYHEGCVDLLNQLDRLDEVAARAAGVPEGRVRVALPAPLAQHLLIPALPMLLEAYPLIDVEIVTADGDLNLVDADVDCAVRVGRIRETSVVAREVGRVSEILCASPGYLRRHAEPGDPGQLRAHLIGSGMPLPDAWAAAEKPGTQGMHGQSRPRVNAADPNAHLCCALAGLGVAFGYRFAFQPHLDAGTLREVLPAHRLPLKPVQLVYYPSRRMPSRVRVFIDWLRDHLIEALGEGGAPDRAPADAEAWFGEAMAQPAC